MVGTDWRALGSIIEKVNKEYQAGNIEGIIVSVKLKSGITASAWTLLPFYELIGMAEMLKFEMQSKVLSRK